MAGDPSRPGRDRTTTATRPVVARIGWLLDAVLVAAGAGAAVVPSGSNTKSPAYATIDSGGQSVVSGLPILDPGLAPSPVPLATFVPPTQRVLWAKTEPMLAGSPPVVVVDSEGPPSPLLYGGSPQELTVLSWDRYAHRWTKVFDSATAAQQFDLSFTFPSSMLDTPDSMEQLSVGDVDPSSSDELFNDVTSFSVMALRDRPQGEDLLVTAQLWAGDSDPTTIVVLHDNGQFVTPDFLYDSHQGSQASVVGPPAHQRVDLVASWQDDDDPACCAARTFHAELAWDRDAKGLVAVADDRPFVGAWVDTVGDFLSRSANGEPASTPTPIGNLAAVPVSSLVVVATVPGSPAARALRPGDVITGVVGGSQQSFGLFDEIDRYYAGQRIVLAVERHGRPLRIPLRSVSRAAVVATGLGGLPDPVTIGVTVVDDADQGARVVSTVADDGARLAGVVAGDVITALGSDAVESPGALGWAEDELGANISSLPLRLVEPSGHVRTVQVDLTQSQNPDFDLL